MEHQEIIFEDALSDDWAKDLDVREVPLENAPLFWSGVVAMVIAVVIVGRMFVVGLVNGDFYRAKAESNLNRYEYLPAPRGIITDRFGAVLAENRAVFTALLDLREFLRYPDLQEKTFEEAARILGIERESIIGMIKDRDLETAVDPIVLAPEITQTQLVALLELDIRTILVRNSFSRSYPDGPRFSSLLGYTGLTTKADLARGPNLRGDDFVGKAGVEAAYDGGLRGQKGITVKLRDAHGEVLGERSERTPEIGKPLTLAIDAKLQSYFYERFAEGLRALGRTTGVGLATDPRNGEVLALVNFPPYDNNLFNTPGKSSELKSLLTSSSRPLFSRAVGGLYTPGSTIKPLVAVAALKEGVISPERTIFSPGYLDVPNPYDPDKPTRFLDWQYQGDVNAHSAIAQSSNVYFFTVGGGANGIRGLGISRLREWWKKFRFGKTTGIDIPNEADGFLPSPEWKEKKTGRPWLLGDTYNVAIGQGDLLVTPIQLLSYVSAIANGGMIYKPRVAQGGAPEALADLREFLAQIREAQKGMELAVRSPRGTAHLLADLPIPIAGKTGTSQVLSGEQENAFFVGYAPAANPEIAILVLVENSREGSLNAVPIAKDVLEWYYWNRIKK